VAVLDNLDIYDTEKFQVLTETEENKQISLFIIDKYGYFEEAYDVPLSPKQDKSQVVNDFLRKNYGVSIVSKQPVVFKLESLLNAAGRIFLIREKTETRGGEYVELMHALNSGHKAKIWFFKKEKIKLSIMLMEYLDLYEVIMRTYFRLADLSSTITRNLEYLLNE